MVFRFSGDFKFIFVLPRTIACFIQELLRIQPLFYANLNFEPIIENGNNENPIISHNDKAILTKLKWSLNFEEWNYIEICAEYKEKGNYIILIYVHADGVRSSFAVKAIQIFVKVDDKLKKCASTKFNIESEEDKKALKKLKKVVKFMFVKTSKKLNDGEMIKDGNNFFALVKLFFGEYSSKFFGLFHVLYPLFDDGEINENRNNFNKNVTKYFMMGENGKAQEINSSTSGQSQPSMDNQIETTQDNHLES